MRKTDIRKLEAPYGETLREVLKNGKERFEDGNVQEAWMGSRDCSAQSYVPKPCMWSFDCAKEI